MSHSGLSTAGAIPVVNEDGKVSMLKVKVQRYVSGRVPNYANISSENEASDEEFIRDRPIRHKNDGSFIHTSSQPIVLVSKEFEQNDRRLQRLNKREEEYNRDPKRARQRHIIEPEIVAIREERRAESSDDEENVERRHEILRQKRLREEEELIQQESEDSEEENEDEQESEYQDSDSEDDIGPRLKPVFVRKKDRITLEEKKIEEVKQREIEIEKKRAAEELRKQALKIIEEENKREISEQEKKEEDQLLDARAAINTDDENEEMSYESWKLRELRRIKRDKDEREILLKEKQEIERVRQMTEEERQEEFRLNPKIITNKAPKGKYKFLQKYYHRGAFYLDQDDETLKRDFAQPTLEDHFDKTVLPKIMQVKNFGRSGRTKYTHLVDQDTTAFDSPWSADTPQTSKFLNTHAGGMKQVFEKPTKKHSNSDYWHSSDLYSNSAV